MTRPDSLIRHTCRNCGGDLKHRTASHHSAELVAVLDCTECGAAHVLRITLTTTKGVAA